MLAADTSVWVAYLRGGGGEAVRVLDEALDRREVALPVPVVAELLVGVREAPERERLEARLGAMPTLDLLRADGLEAGRIGFRLARAGLTVPAVDLLVAAGCIRVGCELLHLDKHFDLIARHSALRLHRRKEAG